MEPVKVEIVFENCEVYECPVHDIKISIRHVRRVAPYPHDKPSVVRCDTDNLTARIRLKNRQLIRRILQYYDITRICITYSNGSELALNVPWNDAHDEYNTYQTAAISPRYFYISISSNKAEANRKDKVFVFNGGVDEAERLHDLQHAARFRMMENNLLLLRDFT